MSTHTYAILEVTAATYQEIKQKLLTAGYDHQLHDKDTTGEVFDMHGLAIKEEAPEDALDYEERVRKIETLFAGVPISYIPALFITAAQAAQRRKAFTPSGMSNLCRKIEAGKI